MKQNPTARRNGAHTAHSTVQTGGPQNIDYAFVVVEKSSADATQNMQDSTYSSVSTGSSSSSSSSSQSFVCSARRRFILPIVVAAASLAAVLIIYADQPRTSAQAAAKAESEPARRKVGGIFDGKGVWKNGVFNTYSYDIDGEVAFLVEKLKIGPGMTVCEVGSANGLLLNAVAKHAPGGSFAATSIKQEELNATAAELAKSGLQVATYLATDELFAPGIPVASCDVLFARMIYHMLSNETAARYAKQWRKALKSKGRMLIADHNPAAGADRDLAWNVILGINPWADYAPKQLESGPRLPITNTMGMVVVPQQTEVYELTKNGPFEVLEGPAKYIYFELGFYTLFSST